MKDKKYYPWLVVALLWVVALLNYLDRQMLSTMQASIGADIPALNNSEAFGALMAIFLWVYGFCSPFSGAVADRLNRKWLIVGSLGVWSAVTGAMAFATNLTEMMVLRGVMGISEALYIPSALSLIADWFTGKNRSLAIGLHMTGLYCGQALGGFGALVASTWSWQATFGWFGVAGVAYAVLLTFLLHDKRSDKSDVSDKSDRSEGVLASLGAVFSTMAFWIILFFFASISMPGWATKNWLPTLFQDNLGISMDWAGPMATLTIAISSFFGVMLGGTLSDRWVKRNVRGRIYISSIGMVMMIPSLVLIGLGHSPVEAIAAGLIFGIGYGMVDANNMPILCQFVPARRRAMAYGFLNSVGVIMGAVITGLLGTLATSIGLGPCFAFMGAILVVALLLQLLCLRPHSDDCI